MKEAYGGIMNIVFIAVFLLIAIGVLGFVVSYTQAFKMKNIVISTIESYEGAGCVESSFSETSDCVMAIKESAKKISYSPTNLNCPTGYTAVADLYCMKSEKKDRRITTRVITQVGIQAPIISNILGMRIFQVAGDTREYYYQGS